MSDINFTACELCGLVHPDTYRLAAIERQVRELADWMDKQADSERVSSDGDEGHRAAEALESYAQELRAIIDAPDSGGRTDET